MRTIPIMSDDDRKIRVVTTPARAAQATADIFIDLAADTGGRDKFQVALAGGNTPRGMYEILSRRRDNGKMPWANMEIFFGDERNVPRDHPDSNYRMTRRSLLDHVPIEPCQVHPMCAGAGDLPAAAAQYEELIRRVVPTGAGGVPEFDVIMLGMGADGHVAGLFADTEGLKEREKLVVAHFVPALGQWRMTFTFGLINAARNVLMLITGEKKAHAVATLLGDDHAARANLPASRVAPVRGKLHIVLDSAAADNANIKRNS